MKRIRVASGEPPPSSIRLRPGPPRDDLPTRRSFRIVASGRDSSALIVRPVASQHVEASVPTAIRVVRHSEQLSNDRTSETHSSENASSYVHRLLPSRVELQIDSVHSSAFVDTRLATIDVEHPTVALSNTIVVGFDSDQPTVALSNNIVVGLDLDHPTVGLSNTFSTTSDVEHTTTVASGNTDSATIDVEHPEVVNVDIADQQNPVGVSIDVDTSSDEVVSIASSDSITVGLTREEMLRERNLVEVEAVHSGRVLCTQCRLRITATTLRVKFRPRSRPVMYCHVDCFRLCVGEPRLTAHPSRIGFSSGITPEEKDRVLSILGNVCVFSQLIPLVGLTTAERRSGQLAEARIRRAEIQRRQANLANASRERYLAARELAPVWRDRDWFGGAPALVYRGLEGNNVNNGLPTKLFESLPRMHVQTANEDDQCVICIEMFFPGESLVVLPCFHRFHPGCIENWFKNNVICPIDRKNVHKMIQTHVVLQ